MKIIDMFTGEETRVGDSYGVELNTIPTSVVDVSQQERREKQDHDKKSSRESYSPFPLEAANLCYEFYLRNCRTIFDPFAGWGERHRWAIEHAKNYIGYDISEEAISFAYNKYGVLNTLADSLTTKPPANFDGFLTCPPYWNLEKYENINGVDKCKTWHEFISKYRSILASAYNAAADGAIFCIMTGDWRKDHKYYDLTFVTDLIFTELGATVVDKIVMSRKKISKIKIMLPQAKRLGYSVRVHESLHVFKKQETN